MGFSFEQDRHERHQLVNRLKMRRVARLDVLDPAEELPAPDIGVGPNMHEESPADETLLIGIVRHHVL
jgi:hypothetical protein